MADSTLYDLDQYLWLVVLSCVCGFIYAFGIGANDVANSFASTVSSKSLTLKQAVLVAAIFEFSGSFFLGASVTSTIRSKIFSTKLYADEPEIIMLGMFTSLFTAMIMLLVATHLGLPVSTTHTIVGAIMGFSISAKGFDSIDWSVSKKIFLSWIISPLVSGVLAFIFFALIRYFVLRTNNPYQRAYYTFPLVLTAGIGIDLFYILNKGTANLKNVHLADKVGLVLGISFGTGALAGLIWMFIIGPIAKQRVEAKLNSVNEVGTVKEEPANGTIHSIGREINADESDAGDEEDDLKLQYVIEPPPKTFAVKQANVEDPEVPIVKKGASGWGQRLADATYNQDLQTQSLHENPKAAKIWEDGEVFDEHAEQLFMYLQVFTACLNSFAHGANDVSNAIAPISAVVAIYQDGYVKSRSDVQKWILAYGGVGIVLGLALYGYKIMKSLGYKVTILSPSRGACAELAASLFVVTASFLEIPVSSTQSICGAVVGVGLAGGLKNIQWLFCLRVSIGWVVVFFSAAVLSAGMFSLLAFSPSLADPVLAIV
jgi:solute carrier family 20 (sodium-dependent phosphate transporter)